jgi:small subunit ribosomal protein S14
MSREAVKQKNEKRKKKVELHFVERARLRKAKKDPNLTAKERAEIQKKFKKMSRDASPIRVVNRCAKTGRPKGVIRFFGLSRIMFRYYALLGLIYGVKKVSW